MPELADQIPGVLIFGATGPTGTLVTDLLRTRGIAVGAVLRSESRRQEFEQIGAEVLRAVVGGRQYDRLARSDDVAYEDRPAGR